ncbi:hypothetical protein RR42_s2809 [Cupriavidus basilensis]|uniref:Uncharacterized protein n=1 Tax=Cupriavidus basilensis TaxID=68895 RepID=A0A0C4YPI3_9BURK|nr:hypothetical protein RR42_s2809 [Cupriavidus basilensis]
MFLRKPRAWPRNQIFPINRASTRWTRGPLDADQRAALHAIAKRCRVHRALHTEGMVKTDSAQECG